ncbi:hypothetical protein, partial [Piscirickettsia salmonis]
METHPFKVININSQLQKDYKDCTKKGREKQTIKFGPDISISEFLDKMNLIKPFLNNKTDEEV